MITIALLVGMVIGTLIGLYVRSSDPNRQKLAALRFKLYQARIDLRHSIDNYKEI